MTAVTARRAILGPLVNAAPGAWQPKARQGVGKHLEPGVVTYDNDDGSKTTYLLTRAAIDKMRPTAAGKPVVGKSGGFDHVKVEEGKKYDGQVTDGFWDGESGWESINFALDNAETAQACERGFEFSCAYIPTEVDETPGLWHNVPYDAVILNGEYTHFAVVPNPRYEGATIELLNTNPGGIMNKVLKAVLALVPRKDLREVFNSIEEDDKKKADLEKKNAADTAKAKADFDEAMKNAKTDEEKAAAQAAFEKANADIAAASGAAPEQPAPAVDLPPEPLGGGDVQPEPGAPGHKPAVAANADPVKPPEETPEQAQEREKAALEKKNAEDAEAAKKKLEDEKKETERINSIKAKAVQDALRIERFNALRKTAQDRGGSTGTPFVGIVSSEEKENLGRDRYGSRKS